MEMFIDNSQIIANQTHTVALASFSSQSTKTTVVLGSPG